MLLLTYQTIQFQEWGFNQRHGLNELDKNFILKYFFCKYFRIIEVCKIIIFNLISSLISALINHNYTLLLHRLKPY